MSSRAPGPAFPRGGPRRVRSTARGRVLALGLLAVAALAVLLGIFTSTYTDLLWFRSTGFTEVFTTRLATEVALFAVFGGVAAAVVFVNVWLGFSRRPVYAAVSPEQHGLERYRQGIEPFRRVLAIVLPLVVGLIAGAAGASEWQRYLLWRHAQPFGQRDPQFGLDVSFFVFDYPWWRFVLSYGFGVLLVCIALALVVHYLYGGVRLQTTGDRSTTAARAHLSVLIGVFLLLKAAAYWFDRYGLALANGNVTSSSAGNPVGTSSSTFVGLTYTSIHTVLPAKQILFFIALICAVLFFTAAVWRTWLLPVAGLGLMIASAVVIGGIAPAVVQQFRVRPSQAERERVPIERNIAATREGFDLQTAQVREYDAETDATSSQLRSDAGSATGIRLQDPNKISPTFVQLQQIRSFYGFPDPLDVDRYTVDGQQQDVVVAVRDLNTAGLTGQQSNWINNHVVYTHGFGFVSALGDQRTADGQPQFNESDIPPTGFLGTFQPRVYFGETSPSYSIVGGQPNGDQVEFDYPDTSGSGQSFTSYTGRGGVPVGSAFHRVLYALKYQDTNILLSSYVTSGSKILYEREPRERVQKVAPWLRLDGDPYPAVVGGRVVYIVDGYTTTNDYPNAARVQLQDSTEDSTTESTTNQTVVAQSADSANYLRNSVKATVDAYDGTVTLYEWDRTDPLLKAWRAAFPGTVKDYSQISPQLMAHLRYPEDLFKVQRDLFAQYHVTDPTAFYNGNDFWRVPVDPTVAAGGTTGTAGAAGSAGSATTEAQPPYYLTLQVPGQSSPSFSLTSTYVPVRRTQLAAFMSVNADPGPDYGTIRVLRLPSNTTVPGPQQVQNNLNSNPDISSQINLLQRGSNSEVVRGNLLTIPLGGGLLYVEPVYVQASQGYPLLQLVQVAFGNRVAIGGTLSAALDSLFQNAAGDTGTGGTGTGTGTGGTGTGGTGTGGTEGTGGANATALQAALAAAQQALDDADTALRNGNFTAYGQAQTRLRQAIAAAAVAETAAGASTASPSPSASARVTASPTPSASAAAPATAAASPTPTG